MGDIRAAVIAEAMSWVGTPYHHLAAVKGAGVDCAMLLVAVYKAVGVLDPEFDPRPYSPQWFLHRSEEKFIGHLLPLASRTQTPVPGDVVLYRFGRTASHGAILVDPERIVHAHRPSRRVELCELRRLERRLDSYWTVLP